MNENQNNKLKTSDPNNWLDIHGDTLFRYSLKYISDNTVAEDLVQETFLAALKNRDSFIGASSEQTWLIGILKNKIIDHYRKYKRDTSSEKKNANVDPDDLDYISSGSDIGSWKIERRPTKWSIDSNDPVEQQQFWSHLNNCLEQLEPRLAVCYYLREIQQIEYKDVCNVLKLKPTNLRVMLHRARKLLRKCLEKNRIDK